MACQRSLYNENILQKVVSHPIVIGFDILNHRGTGTQSNTALIPCH